MEEMSIDIEDVSPEVEEVSIPRTVNIIETDSLADRKRILEKNRDSNLPRPLELSDLETFLECVDEGEDSPENTEEQHLSIEGEPESSATPSPEPCTPRKASAQPEVATAGEATQASAFPGEHKEEEGDDGQGPGAGVDAEDTTCRSVTPPPPRIPTPLQEALMEIRQRRTSRTPPPATICVQLKETPTIVLLEMDYKTLSGEAAHTAWKADMLYYNKTYGIGRLHHRIDDIAQTPPLLHRHAATNTITTSLVDLGAPAAEKTFTTSFPSPEKVRATAAILERIIASNYSRRKQMRIMSRAPVAVGPWPEITRLFRWSAPSGEDVAVTALAWNHADPTLMAVGHGTLHWSMSDSSSGLVRIWSVKNPVHPEKEYHTVAPVSVIAFAPHRPAILTIACRDGKIFMVSLAESTGTLYEVRPSHSAPVTDFAWLELPFDGIQLATAAGDCQVFVRPLQPTISLDFPMVTPKTIKLPRFPGANGCISAITRHQNDPDKLLVGTISGNLLLLLVSRRGSVGGFLKAHSGAVSALERSPFTSEIFFSSGADGDVALWLDSPDSIASEARLLRRFKCGAYQPVETALWSPTHATLFAALSGTQVQLWDVRIKRKTPVAVYDTKKRNSALAFNSNGDRLLVGDELGRIRLLEVSATRAARLPEAALFNALGIP